MGNNLCSFFIISWLLSAPGFHSEPGHLSAPGFHSEPGHLSAPGFHSEPGHLSAPGFHSEPGHLSAPGFHSEPGHLSAPELNTGEKSYVNSIGMKMVRIEPGVFQMGSREHYNEMPIHQVNITQSFHMASTPVTNAHYEQFDPHHKKLRGKAGFSFEDDEAVLFVNWHEAVAFCEWLSGKEGVTYRLPTEAEWEYAARAGTTTRYHTGEDLPEEYHQNQEDIRSWESPPADLHVGRTTPNAWGLHDMHGLVEEWVHDWFGLYTPMPGTNPAGPTAGNVKITRGGSHGTPVRYLRSSTRMGTLPGDKSHYIGFRVVRGEMPDTKPQPEEKPRLWQLDVSQTDYDWDEPKKGPYFEPPISFLNIQRGANGPIYSRHYSEHITTKHVNHLPAVTWLNNGDLFITWFSTINSGGREMTIAASRLKAGSSEWTQADVFFNAPGRNQTGATLFRDHDGRLYWFNGLSSNQGSRAKNALIMSTSTDNGATWDGPVLIGPERGNPDKIHQPIDNIDSVLDPTIRPDGIFMIYSDAPNSEGGGTAIQFIDVDNRTIMFSEQTIAGIHARAVALRDGEGRMLAVGRSLDKTGDDDRMPMSISGDGGNTWEHFESEFPAIAGVQRPVLMRLREGPILLVSFTGPNSSDEGHGRLFVDEKGNEYRGYGMYASLSHDEGNTWEMRKLLTPADDEIYDGGPADFFKATRTRAEPQGYLTAAQTPDHVIHLFSSGLHYRFNLEWLMTPAPAE